MDSSEHTAVAVELADAKALAATLRQELDTTTNTLRATETALEEVECANACVFVFVCVPGVCFRV